MLSTRQLATIVSYATLTLLSTSIRLVNAEDLCSIVPHSYTGAKSTHPELKTAIEMLENYAIASWFTDRQTPQERSDLMKGLLSQCSDDKRLSIVVYGIPNKDCAAGLSSGGSVTSASDYQAFLKELTDAVGDRKVLYVVEPDALGLLAEDGSCGANAGYLENLKVAVSTLSTNANAELYIDIGYWMLANGHSTGKVASAMKEIAGSGRVKGVTINTSNYRSNDECATYCSNFQTAVGSSDMTCIIDTSRNYNGSPTSDWCNVPMAGIGKPPTSETGVSNLDYFMWIKPPGESDGECATGGTSAGSFYLDGFKLLWDQGYFVREQGMPKIGDSSYSAIQGPTASGDSSTTQDTSSQTTAVVTDVPTSDSSSWSQEDIVATVAPAEPISTDVSVPRLSATTENTPEPTARSGCKAKTRMRSL